MYNFQVIYPANGKTTTLKTIIGIYTPQKEHNNQSIDQSIKLPLPSYTTQKKTALTTTPTFLSQYESKISISLVIVVLPVVVVLGKNAPPGTSHASLVSNDPNVPLKYKVRCKRYPDQAVARKWERRAARLVWGGKVGVSMV